MSKTDSPPRPEIAPGHGGPIRTPNNNDVLSGRGGRINSHPGNVRFREMVDGLKRDYLDPRTKKVEKARIAARLVATIRHSDPPGRFLKEDPHTGLWIEIGDERAWKKAGQALRESAPEIRAEQQAQLQAAAERAGGVIAGLGPSPVRRSSPPNETNSRRQADPPGPRHRPNPPEREGLARTREMYQQQLNQYERQVYQQENAFNSRGGNFEGGSYDDELERMRQEYQLQQRIQAEYMRRSNMAQGQNYHGDDYDYQLQQQQQYMQQQNQNHGQRRYSRQEIAAAMMNEDLLPVDAGFVIPSLGGGQQQTYQQCYPVNEDYVPSADQAFNGQQFNPVYSCDKTVSTMSSFDVQSMDMSSLGGFSFANHSLAQNSQQNLNVSAMSGLISTGSALSRSGTSMSRNKKSSLERKLEKVNEAHRRQQMEQTERRRQGMQSQGGQHGDVLLEVPTKTSSSKAPTNAKEMASSLASFGFEDIAEEDHLDEPSVKMSHLGLSEMDMTFNSDIFSIKSKVDKVQEAPPKEDSKPKATKRKSSSGSEEKRRSPDPDSDVPVKKSGNGVAASSVFGSSLDTDTASNRGSMSSNGSMKISSHFDMDHFNESLRSMDLEDRCAMPPDPPSNAGGNSNEQRTRPLMGGTSSRRRQREPTGGSLPSLAAGGKSVERGRPAAPEPAPAVTADLGISDPNLTAEDFGISFNSIRSFASVDSDTSSWLDQYQSMENVTGGKTAWDEEASNG